MKKLFLILCLGFLGITISKAQLVGSSPCLSALPSAPSQVILATQSVTLTANVAPAGFTYRWYDSDQVTLLSSAQAYGTPSLAASKTYYLAYYHTTSGCLSTLVPVRVNRYAENRNWVRTYTSRVSFTSDVALRSGTQSQVMKSTDYYDSLGRLNQKVAVNASVNGWDIITPVVYDSYGRQYRDYLPFANNTTSVGLFRSTATSLHSTYYSGIHGDTRGYGDKTYEASPLNRVTKQGVPGTPGLERKFYLLTQPTLRRMQFVSGQSIPQVFRLALLLTLWELCQNWKLRMKMDKKYTNTRTSWEGLS
jgi:hypothetical protein